MELMIIVWLLLAVGVGYVAERRGLNRLTWFGIALVISAALALLFLIATPNGGTMVDDRALRRNIRQGRADAA